VPERNLYKKKKYNGLAEGYKQIVTTAGHGAEMALTIFEDMINPYWT